MQRDMVDTLRKINNAFYVREAESFSATRQSPWKGWSRVLESVCEKPRTVVDVACGNMRFKSFMEQEFGCDSFTYHGIDSCAALAGLGSSDCIELDIVESLLSGSLCSSLSKLEPDLCAAFGIMHHIPSSELRKSFLKALVEATQHDGLIAVSFWQFASDVKMRKKAELSTKRYAQNYGLTELEEGDYLLGWSDDEPACRYCHSFTSDEIDALAAVAEGQATIADRFVADGRNNAMNGYVVFRRR